MLPGPVLLSSGVHGGSWFAELAATFNYYGGKEICSCFYSLKRKPGLKMGDYHVYFNRFLRLFYKGDESEITNSFLHPMSHELDFMNIYKAFRDKNYVEYYASQTYQPDIFPFCFMK